MRTTLVGLIAGGAAVVGLTLPGCSQEPAAPPPPPVATPARDVDLRDVTLTGLDEYVGTQKGKVVLIDCWATTCAPCVRLFPHTVALHQKYQKSGLVVITLCTDPDDYRAKAAKFLKDRNATCVNFFLADPKPSKVLEAKYPTEALPAMILFDRDGKRVKALTYSDVDEQAMDAAVEAMLTGK